MVLPRVLRKEGVSDGDQYRLLCDDALNRKQYMAHPETYESEQQAVEQIRGARQRIGAELSKVIVGQAETIEQLLIAVLCGGHCFVTGAPGPVPPNSTPPDETTGPPPKTRAARLGAMQEHHGPAAGVSSRLEEPFFV